MDADLLSRPITTAPSVFLDIETTGLDLACGHRVCELALLRIEDGQVVATYESLVNPERLLDPEAAAVNGLHDAELAGAAPFVDHAGALEQITRGALLIAHNAPFDLAFLNAELKQLDRRLTHGPVIDTLVLARRLLRRPSYSLAALAREYGGPTPTHRAMGDVVALRAVFTRFCAAMEELRITAVGDVLRLERGLLPGTSEPETPPLIAQALAEGRELQIVYRSRSTPEPTLRMIRPLYLSQERGGLYLRAFCFLRNNVRAFALAKIESMEMA